MYSVSNLWNASPVRIVTAVMAVIAVLATYGLNIVPDPDKFATALGAVLTLLAGGEVTRASVYSPSSVAAIRALSTANVQGSEKSVQT